MSDTVERALHAILAPSKANTWARCLGALRLCRDMPAEPPNEWAASGTCTHFISEQHLKGIAPVESFLGQELQFDGFKFTVDQDRIDRARKYVDVIEREPGMKFIEHLVDTSPVLGVDGQSGHSDAITADTEMVVTLPDGNQYKGIVSSHDLKDGSRLHYAKDHLQGLIYLSSAMFELDYIYPWEGGRFCVHQPRMHHYDEAFYTRQQIAQFVVMIRPIAKLAWDLYNDVVELDPDKHITPGHEQCEWCDIRASCSKRAQAQIARFSAVDLTQALKLTDEQVSAHYVLLNDIESWCRDIRSEAVRRAAQKRGSIQGFKMVRGKNGNREWRDPKAAKDAILFALPPGMPDEAVFKPRELVSPTQAQKIIGAKQYALIKDQVHQPPGSLSLVPVNDNREEVVLTRAEFTAIDGLDADSII